MWPTASHMRFTWCLRPSCSVSSSRLTRVPRRTIARLGRRGQAVLELDALAERLERVRRRRAVDVGVVDLRRRRSAGARAGARARRRSSAGARPSCRRRAVRRARRARRARRGRRPSGDPAGRRRSSRPRRACSGGRTPAAASRRASRRPRRRRPSPHEGVQLARLPVHPHAPVLDQLVAAPPRGDARASEERVQPHRAHSSVARVPACRGPGSRRGEPTKLADLAVFGANVQPGQLVAVTSFIGKEDAHPQDRARGVPAGREVRRRPLLRPVGQARAHRARGRGHARLRPALDARAAAPPLRRARGAHHALRPARARLRSTGSIPLVRDATSSRTCPRRARSSTACTTSWCDRPGADALVGGDRVPGARRARRPTRSCGRPSRTICRLDADDPAAGVDRARPRS